MVGFMQEFLNEDVLKCVRSRDLKLQLSAIQQTNSGTVKSSTYSDLFMAACFCAFARKKEAMKIGPLIAFTNAELENQYMQTIKDVAQLTDPKSIIKRDAKREQMIFDTEEDVVLPDYGDDDTSSIFPFFTS